MKDKGSVYFKDKLSGDIEKKPDGSFEFNYQDGGESVSLTLPNREEQYRSDSLFPFFDGLIPEGWLLNLTQKNWKISKDDRMTLLLTTCHDCIGATHVQDGMLPIKKDSVTETIKNREHHFSSDRCLVCMEALSDEELYHKKCASNLFGFSHAPIVDVSTEKLEKLALMQINQRLTLTGVQRKLSLSPIVDNRIERLTVLGLDGRFILKPSSEDFPEMAQIEHLCMKLAELQKIPMASCGLVYLTSGELAYVTKRFDRVGKEKIQMEDFCQLSERPTSKKYSASTESLGKVIDAFSDQPQDDKVTLFQIVLFSFWIGNSDMHLKNFSLWRDPKSGLIRMSPGYDFLSTCLLISMDEDNEELALPINGKKNKLRWSDFQSLGKSLKIPDKVIERIKEQMLDTFFEADELIQKSFLSDKMKDRFLALLIERSERLIKP